MSVSGREFFDAAQRYVGVRERISGDHPLIQWWLELCGFDRGVKDEVPWCSAFVNGVAWQLRLPRSKSAAARSWLTVGRPMLAGSIMVGDIIILKRGTGVQPGPEVINAPGHVGICAGFGQILGGNQGNGVSVAPYDIANVLGYRRITE